MCKVPKRAFVGALVCLAGTINNFQRAVFALAILQIKKESHWTETEQGLVLSSFFWGYITTTALGYLAQRYGPKTISFYSTLFASFLYTLIPFSVPTIAFTVSMYALIGCVQGVFVPSLYFFIAQWYPQSEHSMVTALLNIGLSAATFLNFGLGPLIITNLRWQSLFFVVGGLGLLWSIVWALFSNDSPSEENVIWEISSEELGVIKEGMPSKNQDEEHRKNLKFPWKIAIKSPAIWAIVLNHFSTNWGQYVFLSWMPTYLKEQLHFDLTQSGIFSLLPFILMAVLNLLAGWLSDFITNRNYLNKTISRKIFHVFASGIPGIALIVLGALQLDTSAVIGLFCLSIGFTGFAGGSSDVGFLDVTNYHTGTLFGISNTIATIPGIVGVYIVGFLLDNSIYGWNIVFLLAAAIYLVTLIFWLIFARADNVLDIGIENTENSSLLEKNKTVKM